MPQADLMAHGHVTEAGMARLLGALVPLRHPDLTSFPRAFEMSRDRPMKIDTPAAGAIPDSVLEIAEAFRLDLWVIWKPEGWPADPDCVHRLVLRGRPQVTFRSKNLDSSIEVADIGAYAPDMRAMLKIAVASIDRFRLHRPGSAHEAASLARKAAGGASDFIDDKRLMAVAAAERAATKLLCAADLACSPNLTPADGVAIIANAFDAIREADGVAARS